MRIATAADVTALHALIERAYRGDDARRGWTHEADLLGGQRTDAAALAEAIAAPNHHMLLIEAEGRPIGCVQITDKRDGTAYLGLLTVDPDCQAAGLGRRLLFAAEDTAIRAFAATRIEMTVIAQRTELIAWYDRRGYAQTGERRPFPLDDERFGSPKTRELVFEVLAKPL